MSYTVDVNVLLYASNDESPLIRQAKAFLERMAQGPEMAYLFWPTVMAYLRIATHPSIFRRPVPRERALANIERLLDRPYVQTAGEGGGFWRAYREVDEDAKPTGGVVSDAHLVALMIENGVRTIWSHDRDFRRFPSIRVRDPFREPDSR